MILILLFLNYDILKFPQTNKRVTYGTSNKVDSYEKKNQSMMTKFSKIIHCMLTIIEKKVRSLKIRTHSI